MNRYLFIALGLICFFSCKKSEDVAITSLSLNQDSSYPTVISKLSSSELLKAKTSFFQKNKYIESSLNQYGFCFYEDSLRTIESPPNSVALTKTEAMEVIKNFSLKNQETTGVTNPSELTYTNAEPLTGFWDGASGWHFRSSNQRINDIEVLYSEIIFNLKNGEVYYCLGNWFKDVYIPAKFNISLDKAKSSLENKTVSHSTIAGQIYDIKITSLDLNSSIVRTVILPITYNEKIELRVAWEINIPGPVYYLLYVDVMTGEIIGKVPTIIS
jgi:hypothetical protein